MDQGHDNYRDWYDFVWNRTRGIRKVSFLYHYLKCLQHCLKSLTGCWWVHDACVGDWFQTPALPLSYQQDIIQQHLSCPDTVTLIEKCTRFHVHCAHHLCEERTSSFDAKINNENMTKCLQSLKELYHDLAMEQTFCPREAEFRQYSVLLKLNDGDILRSVHSHTNHWLNMCCSNMFLHFEIILCIFCCDWRKKTCPHTSCPHSEVQQFREEVRNSPEVKFAVQAFTAVNSNNFVRFFKLVKGASYLASCLLHRYFNQVRSCFLNEWMRLRKPGIFPSFWTCSWTLERSWMRKCPRVNPGNRVTNHRGGDSNK